MQKILTKDNIRVGAVIVCTDHPEWGTWGVIDQYDEDIWNIRGEAGDRSLYADEFRFWHIRAEVKNKKATEI